MKITECSGKSVHTCKCILSLIIFFENLVKNVIKMKPLLSWCWDSVFSWEYGSFDASLWGRL